MSDRQIQPKHESLSILAFLFPVLCIVFYDHTYPYFYAFMVAPATLLIAAAVDRIVQKWGQNILLGLVFVNLALLAVTVTGSLKHNSKYQNEILENVKAIFPQPVPYLDYAGLVSSYPRVIIGGIFINPESLGMDDYYEANTPIMTDVITTQKPKFLIANAMGLDLERREHHIVENPLMPADVDILANNYLRHWGPLYVPGKRFAFSETLTTNEFDIVIDGLYTVRSAGVVTIDGKDYKNSQTVNLNFGRHSISAQPNSRATLVWGNNIPSFPEPDPDAKKIFNPF